MTQPTLAQPTDVAARATLNATQSAIVPALLVDASAAIRRYCRQQLSYVEDDVVTLIVNADGTVRLPEKPVVSVTSVAVINPDGSNTVVVDWWWDQVDTIAAWWASAVLINAPVRWQDERTDTVQVTYTHGYQPGDIPDEIVTVCCQAVLRKLAQPDAAGLQAINVGGTSQTWTPQLSPGSIYLTADEKLMLSQHARRASTIRLG